MLRPLVAIAPLVFLVGCASSSTEYYDAVNRMNEQRTQIEIARANAESERIKALQSVVYAGDSSSQTAAVMALAFAGTGNESANEGALVMPRQPESRGDIALKWASVLVPSLTNLYGINRNTAVRMEQIESNRELSIHNNETMLGFGRLAVGQEAPIVGTSEDRLIYPRNPADEVIVGTEEDVLIFPTQ